MKIILLTVSILSLILLARYFLYFSNLKTYKPGDLFKAQATLLSEPRLTNFYQTFKVDSVTIQVGKYPDFHYGDKLDISGKVEESSFSTKNGKKVKLLVVKNPEIKKLENKNVLITSSSFIRTRIESTFNFYLPKNESALLFGIVFGGSQGFDKNLYEDFRKTGVLHVVAASGMNVTMLAGFVFLLFSYIFKRRQAIILSLLAVFYYALISGFTASVLRAAIMGSIVFTAEILGKRSTALLSLFITAVFMLFAFPELLFDVGFELSFFSTLGILMIKPVFDSFRLIKKHSGFTDDITTTTSAQIGSLPILVSSFSTYSIISILVNAIVLWTIPILMITGGIAALCSIALPFASVPFLYISYPLLLYFEKIVQTFSGFPVLNLENVPAAVWAGYYMMLISLVFLIRKRK